MTAEQIAELRAWCNSDSYDTPDTDAVLAAIDEREALLGALKVWVPADDRDDLNWHSIGADGVHSYMEGNHATSAETRPICLSRAAIAKAEAP